MWKALCGILISASLLAACSRPPEESQTETSAPAATAEPVRPKVAIPLCDFPLVAPAATASIAAFSDYAWREFLALNWPVKDGERGTPDCNKALGSDSETVWQSFKTTDELFLKNAADPGPWNSPEMPKVLHYTSKANASLPLEESIAQAVGGWLIDQNKNPTYYAISVNETSYNYVVSNQYYNAELVSKASNVSFPSGALEIKAAWKILQGGDDPKRFFKQRALVENFDSDGKPTGTTTEQLVGLVGMHIVYKAEGYPQWLWATFEQVDNIVGPHGTGSYYNPKCSGEYCEPNISPKKSGQPFDSPNQVNRVTPITEQVSNQNSHWQSIVADTPFRYYQLIVPQWPSDPNNPGNPQGTPTPGVAANVTMESYIQPTSSCMDCHSTARVPGDSVKSNYSFIFLFAQSPGDSVASYGGVK